jgi:hypothetical protein
VVWKIRTDVSDWLLECCDNGDGRLDSVKRLLTNRLDHPDDAGSRFV